MNIVDIAKSWAPIEADSTPKPSGGLCICESGSAAPQNNIPVAIVVQMVIENHFHLFKIGLAFSPPILTFPKGEN